MKGVAVARKNALFAGSDGAAGHWAIAMTLIGTAKLNGIDPLAWLTDVLERAWSPAMPRGTNLSNFFPGTGDHPGAVDAVAMAKAA